VDRPGVATAWRQQTVVRRTPNRVRTSKHKDPRTAASMGSRGGILIRFRGSDAADRRPLQSDGCDFGEAQGSKSQGRRLIGVSSRTSGYGSRPHVGGCRDERTRWCGTRTRTEPVPVRLTVCGAAPSLQADQRVARSGWRKRVGIETTERPSMAATDWTEWLNQGLAASGLPTEWIATTPKRDRTGTVARA
jgi:hypothetical protein